MSVFPFAPGVTKTLSATDATGRVLLGAGGTSLEIISLPSEDTAFVAFGTVAVTAATTDYPVLSGTDKVITIPKDATYAAAICASGETATLYFTRGCGA